MAWALGVLPLTASEPFHLAQEAAEVYAYQFSEHSIFGHPALRHAYVQRLPVDGTGPSIMQRSGRRRLYDHNLFLRALYQHRLVHARDGDLGDIFLDAVFVDIGSAILNGDGAPTVRDLREDPSIYPNLHRLVATDINDPETRYVDTYLRSKIPLPFEVREVPLDLDTAAKVADLVQDTRHPLMFRSANAGPDLYYLPTSLPGHFKALLEGGGKRPVLYFFGKYVLYKGPRQAQFEIIGAVDYDMGFNHRLPAWTTVDWNRRTLGDAFTPRLATLAVVGPVAPGPGAEKDFLSVTYSRAIAWQREIAADFEAWQTEADRQLAQALTATAMAFKEVKGRSPRDLAEVAKYALTLSRYDFRRIDRLAFESKTLTVSLKP